jgi:rRNA-processing protein CGR1
VTRAANCRAAAPLQEAARRKQEAQDRKKANQAKSTIVTAVNSATAKKLLKNKKQRKLLKTADTN